MSDFAWGIPTFLSRGFFFLAEAEAPRLADARIALAVSLSKCSRFAISFEAALNPGCFLAIETSQ
jgi:hypothetical protein